jgi:hypothetical protein
MKSRIRRGMQKAMDIRNAHRIWVGNSKTESITWDTLDIMGG